MKNDRSPVPTGPVWYEKFDAEGHRQHKTSWRFPSGALGEVSIQCASDKRQRVTFTWDGPPLDAEDVNSLIDVVLPEILARAEQALATTIASPPVLLIQ